MNRELEDALRSLVDSAQKLADSVRAVAEAAAAMQKADVESSEKKAPEAKVDTKEAPEAEALPEATETEVPFAEDAPEARPAVTKEDVRALLAAKAAVDGGRHKAAVKALVGKYANGGTLRQVPEEKYPELLKDLEAVT